VVALAQACRGPYAELVYVLAMQGLRWGELAGLQVGDRVLVPGPGLRLSRAVLASNGGGELYIDTLKNKRARTVPLVPAVVPIVDRWSAGKCGGKWLFAAPAGGPMRETNWHRRGRCTPNWSVSLGWVRL
jgi:integrase